MTDELPFKVVRSNGTDEILARAINLLIARAPGRVRKERLGATRPTEPKLVPKKRRKPTLMSPG
jgi:hypothetical protein